MSKRKTINIRPDFHKIAVKFWRTPINNRTTTEAIASLISKMFSMGVVDGRESLRPYDAGITYQRGFADGQKHEAAGIGRKAPRMKVSGTP